MAWTESIPGKIWSKSSRFRTRILLSMRWDFLSHHTTPSFPLLNFLETFHLLVYIYAPMYRLNHAHILQKSKAKASHILMPRAHTSCLCSTSLPFFTPSLPQHTKSSALLFRSAMAAAAVATETPFHVLAVDDSLPDRKLIERLLKTSSFQVTTVDSGSKALQFLGLHEEDSPASVHTDQLDVAVNLIITDYCMPGMTGYDLLKKIKESSSLRDIPVVIMSSENIPSRINRCLEEGADEFFLKPVRLSDMRKLKPHILKSRCREHYHQEQLHQQSDSNSDECSNPTNNNSSDSINTRKRKAADTEEVLPQANRSRHS